MVSLITSGRNDDYGKGFMNRFYTSVSKNLESLNKLNIEYEYLIVEWNPFNPYLIYSNEFSDLFKSNKNLKDIIATPSLNLKEGLSINAFHEYYAKNLGIRQSLYENLIILNADIVIPFETMKEMIDIIKEGLDEKKYYRPAMRVQCNDRLHELRKGRVDSPALPEHSYYMKITGDFPGDLFMINKSTLINYGKGYDETNILHRNGSQVHMDSEIMYNLYHSGCTLEYLDSEYYHIEHDRSHRLGEIRMKNINGYQNKENWGFKKYSIKKINNNLILIG